MNLRPLFSLGLATSLFFFAACTTKTTVVRLSPDGGPEEAPTGSDVDGGDPGAPVEASKDGITIGITGVEAALEIDGTHASAGGELVIIMMRVRNVAAKDPVSVALPLFSLSTTDSLITMPEAAASTSLVEECPQTTTIDLGGTLECGIVFDTKQNKAKELRYKTPTGATLAVPVPAVKRCHDLPQLGTPGTLTMGSPFPPSSQPIMPQGTYVLASGVTEGTPGTLLAKTIRVGGSTLDQTVTMPDGVVVQTSATYTTEPPSGFPGLTATLTYTCVSPMFELATTEKMGVGYDPGAKNLLMYVDAQGSDPPALLRWAKKP